MKMRQVSVGLCLALAAACANSPVSPSGSVSLTAPAPVSPTGGVQIADASQPVTVTIANATANDPNVAVVDTIEVATDAAFTKIVQSRDVSQSAGRTSATLAVLPAGQTYFWRVRATAGATVSSVSASASFAIGATVQFQAPTAIEPTGGITVGTALPTLTVGNASYSGPVGAITYRFDIAATPSFATVVSTGMVNEGANGRTVFTPASALAYGTTYYWRAQAIDANGASSAFTTAATFVTPAPGDVLWPNIQPPGTPGKAIRGDNWETQTLVSYAGDVFTSPTIEMRRVFDLMDRGFDPQAAIDWMNSNGYPTSAAYYSRVEVIGFPFMYMALIDGRWDLIYRVGA